MMPEGYQWDDRYIDIHIVQRDIARGSRRSVRCVCSDCSVTTELHLSDISL